jgi:DNA-binding NtrC family response regulator
MDKQTISIVAEDILHRGHLRRMLLRQGFEVNEFALVSQASQAHKSSHPDLVLVSSPQGPEYGLAAVRELQRHDQQIPIILIAPHSPAELTGDKIRGMQYLKMPFVVDDLIAGIERSLSAPALPGAESEPTASYADADEQIVGKSLPIMKITSSLTKIAATDCTVLITGETGTGKELAAKLIHRHSPRSPKPFVVINCSAIPDTLLESELFGHERGSFTGAVAKREGAILSANHGTVFFDEIGDMTPYAQAKLLRTIENKEVWPVGGKKSLLVDARFIAATNRDLEQLMKEGKFRSDLYYRLNVARILLPPLRERQGDIALLLEYFRERYNRQFGKKVEGFTEEAVAALVDYDWPGNIRELKNLMESSFIQAEERISLEDLPEGFRQRLAETETMGQDERSRLITALLSSNWNKVKAAQRLKWSRMTLYRKMAKYGVQSASSLDPELTLQ